MQIMELNARRPKAGKTILLKFGGAAMKDPKLAASLFAQIYELQKRGIAFVMVHGGGPEIDNLLQRLQIEVQKVDGLRVTDSATLEVVEMVLAGKVNKSLVSEASLHGIRAVGLSAIDGQIAQIKEKDANLGFVGQVLSVDVAVVSSLQSAGFMPIICSVAQDQTGQHYNINADELAAALAGALKVDLFLLITDVPGLMRSYPDLSSLISKLSEEEVDDLKQSAAISAGMLPKVEACLDAKRMGAKASLISDNLYLDLLDFLDRGDLPRGTLFT
jgi:acetylglutamate kinase